MIRVIHNLTTARSWPTRAGIVGCAAWIGAGLAVEAATPNRAAAIDETDGPHVVMQVEADRDRVAPGDTLHLGVTFTIREHWHIYWQNAGAAGMPTEITIDAPDGFVVGETRFPRPALFPETEGLCFGYEDTTTLIIPVTVPETASGTTTLEITGDWLVCKTACIIGDGSETIQIDVRPDAPDRSTRLTEVIESLPRQLDDVRGAEATYDNDVLTITGPTAGETVADFLPHDCPGITFGAAKATIDGDLFRLVVPVTVNPANALGQPLIISGLVTLGDDVNDPSIELSLPLAAAPNPHVADHVLKGDER